MHTYPIRLVNSRFCMKKLLRLRRLSVYTYQVRPANTRCLYETSVKFMVVDRVYLPNSPSHETTLKVWVIVRVY